MKTHNRILLSKLIFILPAILIIQSFTGSGRLSSRELKEETWKFVKKDTLSLDIFGSTKVFISGSGSEEIDIKLRYKGRPYEIFEVKEMQRSVYLKENILDYDRHRPTESYFEKWTWIIKVPTGTFIKCNGSSGNFKVTGFNGFFKATLGSGRFIFSNVMGRIDMSSAALRVKIYNSDGSFNISSAVASVRATGLTISGNSSFSTAVGSIKISLARTSEADLYVGSHLNKAQVRLNGHPVTGYFEFIASADGGEIISPFKFDIEETFQDDIKSYRDSSDFGKKSEYMRKSFIRGNSNPKITLKTGTGIAQLIK